MSLPFSCSLSPQTHLKKVGLLLAFSGAPLCGATVWAQGNNTQANDIPVRSVVADSFQLAGERQAGTALKGSATEVGNLGWKVIGDAVLREDGSLTVGNAKGATAWVPLAPSLAQGPFKAQIACQPATTDWVGLALGGELSDFFKTAKIALILRPSGGYALFAGNGAQAWNKPLAQGKAPKFDATGWNTLEIEYDAQTSRLSASINGEKVVDDQNVEQTLGGEQIGFAGFRFNETSGNRPPTQAKVPAVDNFALTPLAETKPAAPAQAAVPAQAAAQPVALQKTDATNVLEPVNRTQFFLQPDQPSVLKWRVSANLKKAAYQLSDYQNRTVASSAVEAGQGELQLPLRLSAGFYELEFPEQKQRFGVVVLPPHQGEFDNFFAIDTALSWLETRPAMRADLLALLKRSGIGLARERLSWQGINPQEGQWDFETARQFDTLRQEYQRNGLHVLDVFHSAPNWVKQDTGSPYPQRLNATKASWQTMGKRWANTWRALEVWNEPDIDFGGEISADQYLPIVKTVSYGLRESGAPTLVGGGVFAYFTPSYIRDAVRNGLLDQVDFASFHTYAKAPSLEQIIGDYRGALTVPGQPSVPLWLTESGQSWASGQPRPAFGEAKTSALEITMKAVEARACGIASYFAFVYPYYVEGRQNFGMMGQEVSPLRSMGTYVQAVKVLSGTRYVGDLKLAGTQRARVFTRGDEAVVVLYTENPQPESAVEWTGNISRLEGIDGRALAKLPDGKIPLLDGMAYVYTSLSSLKGVERQTAAARMYDVAQKVRTQRPAVSPLVLQPLPPSTVQATKRGYRVTGSNLAAFPFRVRINNLSGTAAQVRLQPTINGAKGAALPERQIEVAPSGTEEVQWDVDLAPTFQQTGADSLTLGITGSDSKGQSVSPLSFDVLYPRDLPTYLRIYGASTKVDVTQLDQWTSKVNPTGLGKLAVGEGKIWQLQTSFKGGDRWAYPEFRLPKNVDLGSSVGLLLRARVTSAATARLMMKERTGATYFTPFSFIPTDGQWHTALVRWEDLAALPSAPPDANGRLDFDQVESLALGFNSRTDENSLEVSDLYVVRKAP